jgi:hypothetical protein
MRLPSSNHWNVGSADGVALAVAPALLLVTALLAGLGPARWAGRVDPAVTLHRDGNLLAGNKRWDAAALVTPGRPNKRLCEL